MIPFTEAIVEWTIGTLYVACYLTESEPPSKHVTSARAVVTDGSRVVVVQDLSKKYVVPGGRLEKGETPKDAMQREVLEETGWTVAGFRQIGVLHYRHPRPEGTGSPRPLEEFLQIVYAAMPGEYRPELKEMDGYELGAELMPVSEARRLPLNPGELEFLDVAVEVARASSPQ